MTACPWEKPGWVLTFHDEFDRPQLNDLYWYPAYRSGKEEYCARLGKTPRWVDNNAHVVIEDSVLKLRLSDRLPYRPTPQHQCVSCITTSDHRFGKDETEYRILDKFSQKYGWFETRCRMPRGSGVMSAFWLHQVDPTKQEFTPRGERKGLADGPLEIDIFEQQGRYIEDHRSRVDLNVHFTADGHYLHACPVDLSRDFHIWAMDWEADSITWYLDGQALERYVGPTPHERMFILLALFQYSGWIGEIDPQLPYPLDFEVDYVRVYARQQGPSPSLA